jgi:hypothetical protein
MIRDETVDVLDLGTTLGLLVRGDGTRTGLTGAVSWQNATAATLDYNDRSARVPRPLRVGVTVETAFEKKSRPGDLAKFMVAYTRTFRLGETHRDDTDHLGAELVLLELLALRWGFNDRFSDGVTGLGVGIVLGERFLGPLTLEADVGQLSYDADFAGADNEKTAWGVRARYAF